MDPLVSIVTPCRNAEAFLEETIQSVLRQDYPNIEYLVVDGASTDATVDILRRYQDQLEWISEPDRGTPDAINKGFDRSRGSIFAYLNADDLLLPGAVSAAVEAIEASPNAAGVYGDAWWIGEDGTRLGRYPVRDWDAKLLETECFLCQPATFLRRDAFLNLGRMDPELHLSFDYEFWMRLARVYRMERVDKTLACSRMHRGNKSLADKRAVFEETFQILLRHYGYIPFRWVYSFLCNASDGRDQFFKPLKPSPLRYAQSLPRGLILNSRAPARYFWEWLRILSQSGVRRLLHPFSARDM